MLGPVVVAKISGAGTSGEHDVIVVMHMSRGTGRGMFSGIEFGDFIHQHRDIIGIAEDLADRLGNVWSGERCGGDLIKQGLKEVMVGAIDECDVDPRLVGKAQCAF